MSDGHSDRNGSTNGPTEPNQRPAERREDASEEAMKGGKIISEANQRQRNEASQHPAGPHATEAKTNREATPGSGALPSTKPAREVEPGTG